MKGNLKIAYIRDDFVQQLISQFIALYKNIQLRGRKIKVAHFT